MDTIAGALLKSATYRVNFVYAGRARYAWVTAEYGGDGLRFFIDGSITRGEYAAIAPTLHALADITATADFQVFVWKETGAENFVMENERVPMPITDYLGARDVEAQ
jgi:hypothetical protein